MELTPLEWLPLFTLFLHRLLYVPPGGKRRPRDGVLAVAVLIATALTSWYLTLYLLMIGGLLALVRLVERPREWRATLGATAAVDAGLGGDCQAVPVRDNSLQRGPELPVGQRAGLRGALLAQPA